VGRYVRRFRKILLHHVLHADDSPHAIALGVGVATLVAFLPLVGFQTAIALGVAALLRANKAVCIPIVWITNPFTIVPIYGACLALGRWLLAAPASSDEVEVLARLAPEPEAVHSLLAWGFWKNLFVHLAGLGVELWVGCAIVGVVLGLLSYGLARWGVVSYRERRRQRMLRRNLIRAAVSANLLARRRESA